MSEIWNLNTLCRCCHADGHFKSLNWTYQGENEIEIYENMLQETLGVTLFTPALEASYTICDECIIKLRDASNFRRQVLMCEQKFQVYCKNEQFVAPHDIKLEVNDEDEVDHEEKEVVMMHAKVEVKKENYSAPQNTKLVAKDITTIEKFDKLSEVANNNINITKNGRQRLGDENIKKNPKGQLDLTLMIQVDTDSGVQFSCKNCGGCYHTQKEIKHHIFKTHGVYFKCEYCPNQLKSLNSLRNHLKLHTGKDFHCPFCPKKFATKNCLEMHINSHTREKIFKCEICQKDFKYKQTLFKHMRLHSGTNKKKLCHLCGRSFNDKSNMDAHINAVHRKLKPYTCSKCGKAYSSKRHLRDHSKIHDDEKLYKCDVCDHTLSCPKTMKIHRLKHENKYMCRFCPLIFEDMSSRRDHVTSEHNEKVSCTLCTKLFSSKYSLKRHMDDHMGNKKFPCDICGLKFSQKTVLNRHIFRKHNPEIDINAGKTKCDICKGSFKNIIVHMDSHNKRSCACDVCGKTYPDNSALNRHKSIKHFGKSYECDLCGKKYMQNGKLNTHKIKVHKIKIEKDSSEGS